MDHESFVARDGTRALLDSTVIFPYVGACLFLGLSLFGVLHHEMWRDELQAWLVARDSHSWLQVISNVRYERTPALWQICLHLLTYFTQNPLAMQLFHVVIATTSVFLFAKYSPFTRFQKLIFSFGYFTAYEYAMISRSYALGVLLIMLTCTLLTRARRPYLLIAFTLSLLAHTSLYGLMLAPPFALFVGGEILVKYRRTHFFPGLRVLLPAILLFVVSIAASLNQLRPPADYGVGYSLPVIPTAERDSLVGSFRPIFLSYVAIPNMFEAKNWGTNIIEAAPVSTGRRLSVFAALVLFASAVALFSRKPIVLLTFLSGTGVILVFNATIYQGEIRHLGHLFIFFIACFWLLAANRDDGKLEPSLISAFLQRYQFVFVTTILFLQLIGGAVAFVTDVQKPFSETKVVADFLRERLTPETEFAGTSYIVSPVTAYLSQRCYMLDRQAFGTFMIWDKRTMVFANDEEKLQGLAKLFTREKQEVVYISEVAFKPESKEFEVTELAHFNSGINRDQFYIYQVRRTPAGSVPVSLNNPAFPHSQTSRSKS